MDDKPRRASPVLPAGGRSCASLLVPLADDDFRGSPLAVAITYVVLALASYLDFRGRH